jgi:hypothetical protein
MSNYFKQERDREIAFKEICKDEITYMHKEDYLPWLEKHRHLRMEGYIPEYLPLIKPQDFNQVYYQLSRMASFLRYTEEAKQANEEYKLIDFNVEKSLLDWLCLYENLGYQIHPIIETNLNAEENEEEFQTGFISIDTDYNARIAVVDYVDVLDFLNNLYSHYWKKLEEYGGLRDASKDVYDDDYEFDTESHALRSLLESRMKNEE